VSIICHEMKIFHSKNFPFLVVAETVVGVTTGVVPAPKGYFKAMRSVCKKYDALFILDEVMCGMGRKSIYGFKFPAKRNKGFLTGMGTTHAWQSFGDGVAPDIQAIAKSLGGG
jgi:E3 ubiquitin-protein ligase TRIP12